MTRRIPPLLAGHLFAGLGQGAATAAEVRIPQPGIVCEASGRICRSRSEAAEAGLFRLGPALRCNSQVGLCWQDKPMQTVNWRASRELFGSTSPGSGWGEWRPYGGQLPMQWQSQCQLRQQATLLYEGPCSFREAAAISELPEWASRETAGSPVRTLTITLGDQRTLRFVWDQDRYRLADDGRGPTLSLLDQGSRGVWRWAGMQLFSARSRADLVPPAPADDESTAESTAEAGAELLDQAPRAKTPSVRTAAGEAVQNTPGR